MSKQIICCQLTVVLEGEGCRDLDGVQAAAVPGSESWRGTLLTQPRCNRYVVTPQLAKFAPSIYLIGKGQKNRLKIRVFNCNDVNRMFLV